MSLKCALFLTKRFQIKNLISSSYQLSYASVRYDTRTNFLTQYRLCSTGKGEVMKQNRQRWCCCFTLFFLSHE